ncbi:TPA: hypothetical protein ACH3X2_005795 [Trebouxia sp. C0005]
MMPTSLENSIVTAKASVVSVGVSEQMNPTDMNAYASLVMNISASSVIGSHLPLRLSRVSGDV